jgi:hypothetical protein
LLLALPVIASAWRRKDIELDRNTYPKGIKVSDAEMASLNITRDAFHPEWNYNISLRNPNMKR